MDLRVNRDGRKLEPEVYALTALMVFAFTVAAVTILGVVLMLIVATKGIIIPILMLFGVLVYFLAPVMDKHL